MKRMGRLAFAAAALLALAARPSARSSGSLREQVEAWRRGHEVAILRELADLLTIPNVAADRVNIEKNAAHVAQILEKRGIRTELLRVADAPPVVFGELLAPGARRTVVFYAHYDGQPVDAKQWASDPWKPVLRDRPLEAGGREIPWEGLPVSLDPEWRLYGRSSSDDRAPLIGWMAALDALAATGRKPSVNLKFFLEGEEEAGSPHLEAILDRYAEKLRGDLWLLCDGPVHQSRRMQVFFGARGVTDVELTVYGPNRRLHSGHYGNWAPNPIAEMARLLASLRDDEGTILVPHFSDDVRPLSESERRALAEVPDADVALRAELDLGRSEGKGERLVDAIQKPALNFRGIRGGDVGSTATNSIPTEATASIDFRLVPDQTPAKVRAAIEAFLRGQGYFLVNETPDRRSRQEQAKIVKLVWGSGGYPGYRTPMDQPIARAVVAAVEEAAGGPVIRLPSLGGSIPMSLFAAKLGVPIIGIPIANHDNNQHAANENLRLQNLWDGIDIYASLFEGLASVNPR